MRYWLFVSLKYILIRFKSLWIARPKAMHGQEVLSLLYSPPHTPAQAVVWICIFLSLMGYLLSPSVHATPCVRAVSDLIEAEEERSLHLTPTQLGTVQQGISLLQSYSQADISPFLVCEILSPLGTYGAAAEVHNLYRTQRTPPLATRQKKNSLFDALFSTHGPKNKVHGLFQAHSALKPALTADQQRDSSLFESLFGTHGPTTEVHGLFEAHSALKPALTADQQRDSSLFESFWGAYAPTAEVQGLFEALEALRPALTADRERHFFWDAYAPTAEVQGLFEALEALRPALTADRERHPFWDASSPTAEAQSLSETLTALTADREHRPFWDTSSPTAEAQSLSETLTALTADRERHPFWDTSSSTAEAQGLSETLTALTADRERHYASTSSAFSQPALTTREDLPKGPSRPLEKREPPQQEHAPPLTNTSAELLYTQSETPLWGPREEAPSLSAESPWATFDLLNLYTHVQLATVFSSPQSGERPGVWIHPLGYVYKQRGSLTECKARMGGVALGATYCKSERFFMGGGIALTSTSKRSGTHGTFQTTALGVYAGYTGDLLMIDGTILGGLCRTHTPQHIQHSYEGSAHLGIQSPMRWGRYRLSPFSKTSYSHNKTSLTRYELGLSLSSIWKIEAQTSLQPTMWLSGIHEHYLDSPTKRLHSSLFLVSPGASFTLRCLEGLSLFLRYGIEIHSEIHIQKLDGRIEWSF